jgi:hypothetical protein
MCQGNLSSPSVQGSGSGGKGKRAQNVVPVQVNIIILIFMLYSFLQALPMIGNSLQSYSEFFRYRRF